MPRTTHMSETHRSHRAAWLRAAVLGANDGIVSTASLMLGVAAARAAPSTIVTAGGAGLVAGAMSMAAGEFVSVSSQRDTERADLAKEQAEIEDFPEAEMRELTEIYVRRGLSRELAAQVSREMHAHDALGAHLRDELGLDREQLADPVQAAWTSALAFSTGAILPVLAALTKASWLIVVVSLVALGALGVVGARLGGASERNGAVRVLVGGAAAMAITSAIGSLLGAVL